MGRKIGLGLLGALCILLLVSALFSLLGIGSVKTFYGFLQMMEQTPTISLEWLNWEWLSIFEGDWGVFEILRIQFVLLGDILNAVGFIGTGLVQLCTYLIYFFRWLIL